MPAATRAQAPSRPATVANTAVASKPRTKAIPVLIVSTLSFTVCFMLMYGVVWVSLIRMYWTEVRGAELMGPKSKAFSLHG